MNITPDSMEMVIFRHMEDPDADPQLKKMIAELKALKEELNGSSKAFTKPIHETSRMTVTKGKKKRRQTEGDTVYRASVKLPSVRRSSDRLFGRLPQYELMYDIDNIENNRLFANGQLKVDSKARERKSFSRPHQRFTDRTILSPEEVTEEMLRNICYKLNDRIYDAINGSSCHQCRQKTRDTKTICRNFDCIGVRGQFCGPCAQNRYGVDVAVALLDPFWSCFVCQGICNCSFCRARKGKRPTGILSHIAKREGHDSVKEFLDQLKINLSEEDDYWEHMNDPESIFGFVDDRTILTVDGKEEICIGNLSSMKTSILEEIIDCFSSCSYFSGFMNDSISNSIEKINAIQTFLENF